MEDGVHQADKGVLAPSLREVGTDRDHVNSHPSEQVYLRLFVLAILLALLAATGVLLARSSHISTPDFRTVIKMLGGLVGLAAGLTLIANFYAVSSRFHLFIGVGLVAETTSDLITALTRFVGEHVVTGVSLAGPRFIFWNHISGRALVALLLVMAAFLPEGKRYSRHPRAELVGFCIAGVLLGVAMVRILAIHAPPMVVFPERFVSRPLDLMVAGVLFVALVKLIHVYYRTHDILTWWLLLLVACGIVGEVMMSYSNTLHDSYFDLGGLYKSFSYVALLMGFSFHATVLIRERDRSRRDIARLNTVLQAMSLVDDLTGLYNRRGFLALARQQLKLAKRTGRRSVVVFSDIDNLKRINDEMGHAEGDQALIDTAEVFKETFRGADIIGRMSGDEFVVLAFEVPPAEEKALVDRLQQNCTEFNRRRKRPYTLKISVGTVACEPDAPDSIEDLVDAADRRMYQHKQRKTAAPDS